MSRVVCKVQVGTITRDVAVVGVQVTPTVGGAAREVPTHIVVEYMGGTMRLSLDTWRDVVRCAEESLHDAFQEVAPRAVFQDAARGARAPKPRRG